MPSMDIVSKVDLHELANSVDQTNREISTRFDFKGSDAKLEQTEGAIKFIAQSDFQIQQMQDIFHKKLVKRGVDLDSIQYEDIEVSGRQVTRKAAAQEGIDKEYARKIVKDIKQSKLKVQVSIQQDQVRVSGKKRDDLQTVIAMLKGGDMSLPLQFVNFRD